MAAEIGVRVALLDERYDVDEPRDLARLAEDLRAGRADCPFTAAVLAETPNGTPHSAQVHGRSGSASVRGENAAE